MSGGGVGVGGDVGVGVVRFGASGLLRPILKSMCSPFTTTKQGTGGLKSTLRWKAEVVQPSRDALKSSDRG